MTEHTPIPGMIDGIRRILRTRAYSPTTEKAYLSWITRFLRFHNSPHWRSLDKGHAEEFLHHLTSSEGLGPKSRNQAASALAFLFREALDSDAMDNVKRARTPHTERPVMSHREAMRVLSELRGKYRLLAELMYGSGLRVKEAVSVRVKDLDFDLDQILIREGKGKKDRFVPLAFSLRAELKRQRRSVEELYRADLKNGGGWARLPGALHRKNPQAGNSLLWQFLFPSSRESHDPATERRGRWHIHESALQRQVHEAVRSAGIPKVASSHTFRHSFATQMLRDGLDLRTLGRIMGHQDIRTTQRYLHAIQQVGLRIRSPLDRPPDP